MAVIDADCHIIECDKTWDYFDDKEMRYKPLSLKLANGESEDGRRFLSIDGRLRQTAAAVEDPRGRSAHGVKEGREDMAGFSRTTEAMRTMSDVEGRLKHMDQLKVDVQILFPTSMVLGQITPKREVEVALCRSYNRWMADVSSVDSRRLRWIATPPLMDIKESIAQMEWAKEHGAVGIRVRGFEGDRLCSDPYFFPVYEAAGEMGLAVTFHAGNANPAYASLSSGSAWAANKVPVMSAFQNLCYYEVPAKFPKVNWGFIEAAASWVPYMLIDLERRMVRDGKTPLTKTPLKDLNFFVASQTNDDFQNIIQYAGEDNLVIGSDYGHSDTSSELEALKNFEELSGLSHDVCKKICEDNPAVLFGL